MTQYPGYPSDPSLPYATPPASRRPTSVTVLAILAMVFGGLGTFCGAIGAVFALVAIAMGGAMKANPAFGAGMHLSPAINAYNAIIAIVNLILSVTLLMVGIGGMTLKTWARSVAMGWAIARIIVATIEMVLQLTWVSPASIAALRKAQPGNPALSFMSGFSTGGAIGIWILVCILPVCFLIFWNRPNVKAAFADTPATT